MEPDAGIIVRSGVRLLLQYVDIVGCDEMWDRIKVESGGELIVENAYFQDGQYAIWLEPGAKLSLKYSKFTNNRVGVYVPNTYATASQTEVDILSFYGNVFEGTAGGLKPPYAGQRAWCGVEAHDLKNLPIVGVHAENAAYNFFENMTYGIIAENTNLVVRYCHFEDIEAQSGTGGYGIYTTSPLNFSRTLEQSGFGTSSEMGFVNCDMGIYGEVTRMNITQNHMQDMGRGVVALRSRRVQVKNNAISSRNNGISLVQNSPCKCEIEDNELYIDDDETVPTAHGIRVDETLYGVPGDVYRIRNNYVELENAVFAAHALYELKMGNHLYDDSLLCAPTRNLIRPGNTDLHRVPYIYPNPNSSGLAVVEIPGLEKEGLTALVYNQHGVVVNTIPLQGSGDRYLLEVESLVSGIYFIQIQTGEEVLPATRFILVK